MAMKELQPARELAERLPREELPQFLGELETIRVIATARLASPMIEQRDELLEVPEAAARLSCSTDYLYRNSKRLPFVRRLGRKLLFSSAGLDAYLKRRQR